MTKLKLTISSDDQIKIIDCTEEKKKNSMKDEKPSVMSDVQNGKCMRPGIDKIGMWKSDASFLLFSGILCVVICEEFLGVNDGFLFFSYFLLCLGIISFVTGFLCPRFLKYLKNYIRVCYSAFIIAGLSVSLAWLIFRIRRYAGTDFGFVSYILVLIGAIFLLVGLRLEICSNKE